MKQNAAIFIISLLTLAIGACFVAGCGGGSVGIGGGSTPTTITGIIYIANTGANSILSFNSASTVNGDTAPSRTVAGAATTIASPFHIFLDRTNNRLYIANATNNSVLIYDSASSINGNTAPSRTLVGAATNLNEPGGIFVDTSNNVLYVGNIAGNSITIYNNASVVNGNTAPTREITFLNHTPFGIGVDVTRNVLYCSLSGTDTIGVWDNALQVNGSVPPTRTIFGLNTLLSAPDGIFVDSTNDRIYVVNPGNNNMIVYDNAAAVTGNAPPNRVLVGANTLLGNPVDVTLDTTNNRLLITNQGDNSILIFDNAATVDGNTAPTRRIVGAATTLNTPTGIAVDMTRNGTP